MYRKAAIPFMLAIAASFGLWMGYTMSSADSKGMGNQWQKVDQILQYVESDYVDTVSRKKLEDEVIAYLLQRLDPHSYYINKDDLSAMNEPLEGGFEGIGVQFSLTTDTIYVVNTIEGGPSQKAGIKSGDKIISVDGKTVAGIGMTSKDVMALLKGPAGTEVELEVLHFGNPNPVKIQVVRDEIPLHSIDAAYLIDDSTAYVKLARFSKTTQDEFMERVYRLNSPFLKHVILDLRGNGGGFLDAAVNLADEFLADNLLITYTEGKARPRSEYRASERGSFEDKKLYLIIDNYSASASEIFAGAMQDHKRALIFGQRSFGKGLVQEQSEWNDGSATRLTVARYYTPNGRSIQRPYSSFTDLDAYFAMDSLAQSAGGISPDFEVPLDTSGLTWLYAELIHSGTLTEFAYKYRDIHNVDLMKLGVAGFVRSENQGLLMQELKRYLLEEKISFNQAEWERSAELIGLRTKALIARTVYGEEAYFMVSNRGDENIQIILKGIKKPES